MTAGEGSLAKSSPILRLIRRLSGSAIAALIVLAVTVSAMTYITWRSTQWVRHSRATQLVAARAYDLVLERQIGIDGLLVSADTAARSSDRRSRRVLQLTLDSLSVLTSDNPTQQANLLDVASAIAKWEGTYSDRVLRAPDSAGRVRIAAGEGRGVRVLADVRSAMDRFDVEESSLYLERLQRNALWRWGEVVVVVLEAVVVLFILARLRRELLVRAGVQMDQQALLEEQAIELEAQAVEQEALAADLELSNQELSEATVEAEEARDTALVLEERYRLLFDCNPVPMWVYEVGSLRFLAVNEAAVIQYGYTVDEFLSMTLDEIRPPEDIPLLRRALPRPDYERHESLGRRHRRKNGTIIKVDIVTHSVEFEGRHARLVLALDVTAREQARAALGESNSILRAVVEDSPLAIIIFSPDLIVTRWNAAATRQFGWTADEAVGMSALELIPEEHRKESERLWLRLHAGEVITNFETRRLRSDGKIRDVHLSHCALHNAGGELTGFVEIISDETEHKRMESQFRQSQKMEAVGQLAGGVAHDFNNLLTVIISYSQMLSAETAEGSTSRADVQEIKRAAERAAVLTKQLLAFSRQQVLRPQMLDLNLVVGDLEQMMRRLLREDISILFKLDPMLGTIAADPGQIEQIVLNLAVNARDAMPNGGRLTVETANVEFESPYQMRANEDPLAIGSYVMIAVSDTGTGMTPEVQAHAFEPFFTTKRMHEGTGLGLSTVYGIVKQSGGHLAIYSEVGHGTIFKIYLPRVDATAEARTSDEAAQPALPSGAETLLIVEDDAALRTVACRALLECGYTVLAASDGQEALRICAEHEGTIQLVVTDMVMPEMSGTQLAERLAASFPDIQVLLMSGYTRDEAARRSIASERYSFLEKPFTPTKLAARVREVLDGRRVNGSVLQQA